MDEKHLIPKTYYQEKRHFEKSLLHERGLYDSYIMNKCPGYTSTTSSHLLRVNKFDKKAHNPYKQFPDRSQNTFFRNLFVFYLFFIV